ncbi:MAG: hypothetical protein GVY24_06470, partial [Planctomycetes bacterium]|nr:hypothetical protein [Planctomycetota bacterium]
QVGASGVEAILPNFVMYDPNLKDYTDAKIQQDVDTFIHDHGFTGFHIPAVAGYWFDVDGSRDVPTSAADPDPAAFAALEKLITATHEAGGVVHIWPWGDEGRKQTAEELPGGQNGASDQRLQKHIASRLGALPGWTIGYGFDLDEWTDNAKMQEWRNRVNGESGWAHLISGRSEGPNSGTDHSGDTQWHVGLDYAGYEHHAPSYEVYVAAFEAMHGGQPVNKPVMSEDRFRVRGFDGHGKDFTYDDTRRTLWIATMAGGAANIFGNLTKTGGLTVSGNDGGSLPYPDGTLGYPAGTTEVQQQIKTWSTFFNDHQRFLVDMERQNDLTGGPANQQYALESKDGNLIVIYGEDTDEIAVKLSELIGDSDWSAGAKIIAVDTREVYQEIDLGAFSLTDETIDLGQTSDWALAVTPVPEPGVLGLLAPVIVGLFVRRPRET